MPYRVSCLVKVYEVLRRGHSLTSCMSMQDVRFDPFPQRPDPFLSEGITFLRHDPDWRPYYIPIQTRLTK